MPELPEVETVRKKLLEKVQNKTIDDVQIIYDKIIKNVDPKTFKDSLKNQKILDIKRYGKWLIFCLSDYYLLSHLRMEGKYLYKDSNEEIEKHEHIIFHLGDKKLIYKDVRKFGCMYLFDKTIDIYNVKPLTDVGYEPWDKKLNVEYLKDKYNKNIPIKTLLLDQTILTGIGNIYADEILFLSHINPLLKGKNLTNKNLEDIIKNTCVVLEQGIKNGGTTIRSYTSLDNESGHNQNNLLVHKRENEECKNCSSLIKKIKIGGRSTYYCEKCQK